MAFRMLMLAFCLFLISGSAWGFAEKERYLDQGFGAGTVTPEAIMIHSNAYLPGMFESGFAYHYLIYENGTLEKWLPKGSNATPYRYKDFSVAYHGGKGVFPGEKMPRSMNLATIGIGLYYPIGKTSSEIQMRSLADLTVNLTLANPANNTYTGIRYVFGQNVSAGYRMQNVTLFDGAGYITNAVNADMVMYNPWNFNISAFATILNDAGKFHGLRWKLVSGNGSYLNATSGRIATWPIEYLERQT